MYMKRYFFAYGLFCSLVLMAYPDQLQVYPECFYIPTPAGPKHIMLVNDPTDFGWVEFYNLTDDFIRIINVAEPQYTQLFEPYQRLSSMWNGRHEIKCFKTKSGARDDSTQDTEVDCSSVIVLSRCIKNEPSAARFNRLNLFKPQTNKPAEAVGEHHSVASPLSSSPTY